MPKYRMYVDEVGNSDLRSAIDQNHRFLSLTGVILSLNTVKNQLYPDLEDLKTRFFDSHPDEPVIFHRKEMINGIGPFEALRNTTTREKFNDELLNIISKTDFKMITVVLDKLVFSKRYEEWRYDPYHYCMAILLERYVRYLGKKKLHGDVFAETRGGKENMRLKKSFRQICEEGTQYIAPNTIGNVITSREIKMKSKANNISGLQLADLLAHPSRREILLENKKIDDGRRNIFAEQIVEIIRSKYLQYNGEIYGTGKIFLP